MCFFRRKSKRAAAAKSVAASAASATTPDSSPSEPALARMESAADGGVTAGSTAVSMSVSTSSVAVLTDRSAADVATDRTDPMTDGAITGPPDAPAPDLLSDGSSTRAGDGVGAGGTPSGIAGPGDTSEPRGDEAPNDGAPDNEAAHGGAGGTETTSDEGVLEESADEQGTAPATPRASADSASEVDASASGSSEIEDRTSGAERRVPAEPELAETRVGGPAEVGESGVPSSVDMALPQPEIVDNGPRDQVWGQDRPGPEGKSVAALNQLIEAVTMSASEEELRPGLAGAAETTEPVWPAALPEQDAEPAADATTSDVDPDEMEELPTDRPVPADAIRRASEALDAAVNAAPAVLGPASPIDDDEEVALVDAEFTHSDGETGPESEPEHLASDYSVRVTDPIPVQSLSAPGVSRETSGSVQMPQGTQQPTGGPHGGDDERRSALIATVPAVDDTTPVAAELAMDARRRIELQGRRFPRPPKTRIITVANQKGGVGKTTTTVNVAAGLAQSGLNVLVIDNDPQGNASTALGIEHRAGTPSVYEILVEGESLASTVQQCPDVPNLWGVPATIDLSGSEIELVSLVSRETRLRKAIDKYLADRVAAGEDRIDYVLIDCPPSLGLLTVNAFVAGREVFIPIQCEYYALEGLSQLLKTIDLIRSHLNPELRVSSILLTMYDGRTNLAQQVAGEVRSHFPAETFKTTIPRSVRISEAPSYGQTVMTYDATSTGALAYLQASRELAERGQGGSSPRRAVQAEPVGAQD